jgi:hypothetical protein
VAERELPIGFLLDDLHSIARTDDVVHDEHAMRPVRGRFHFLRQ